MRAFILRKLSLVVLLGCILVAAQQPPTGDLGSDAAQIHLEPHNGQTRFKIGDLIWLDLVFSSAKPGYSVNTDANPYLPAPDWADIRPADGWVRGHIATQGGMNGADTVDLRDRPIRVSVLLNRTIVFQKPGRYSVTLRTERLQTKVGSPAETGVACANCRETNAIAINITAPDEQEESSLVKILSNALSTPPIEPSLDGSTLTIQQQALLHLAEQRRNAGAGQMDEKKDRELMDKLQALAAQMVSAHQHQEADRRTMAQRLAYLGGDEAIRAKVSLITQGDPLGEGNAIVPLLIDGLPSARNLELQFHLLESAWRDPHNVPAGTLQTALRESNELLDGQPVLDESMLWAGTAEQREAHVAEYSSERSQIVASLSERTAANRAATAYFLASGRPGLSSSDEARVHAVAIESFSQLTYTLQTNLLQLDWDRIRDPALVPVLKARLDAQSNFVDLIALERLIDLSPQSATPYVLRVICDMNPASNVPPSYLLGLPAALLPAADACLEKEFRSYSGNALGVLPQKVELAARYGSQSLLPMIEQIYTTYKGRYTAQQQADFLAYFSRYAPKQAVQEIEALDPSSLPSAFQEIDAVFSAAHLAFPLELINWLRAKAANNQQNPQGSAWANEQLLRFGRDVNSSPVPPQS